MLRLRGMVVNEVIATLATAIVIIEVLRYLGFSGFTYVLPEFIKGSVNIGKAWLDYQRIFLVGIGVALIIILYFFTHRTRVGLSFRAIAQNERTAISLGSTPTGQPHSAWPSVQPLQSWQGWPSCPQAQSIRRWDTTS